MAKEFAESFYKSKVWQNCRASYIKSVGGLCEDCMKKGIIRNGEIVHHIKHIDKNNINDVTVTLDWSNLRYVCRNCHAIAHKHTSNRRYTIGKDGRVEVHEV